MKSKHIHSAQTQIRSMDPLHTPSKEEVEMELQRLQVYFVSSTYKIQNEYHESHIHKWNLSQLTGGRGKTSAFIFVMKISAQNF